MFVSFKVGIIYDKDGKTSKLASETCAQVFSAEKLGYIKVSCKIKIQLGQW